MAVMIRCSCNAATVARAALHAAWAALEIGAVAFASMFAIQNLAFGAYLIATGQVKFILELLQIIVGAVVGGAFQFVVLLAFSLVITLPVTSVVALCAFPFLPTLQAAGRGVFGVVGFLVGALVWAGLWWKAPPDNIVFGSWMSWFIIGGLAGCAGGLAFARRLQQRS
jgi:hypothetical protein